MRRVCPLRSRGLGLEDGSVGMVEPINIGFMKKSILVARTLLQQTTSSQPNFRNVQQKCKAGIVVGPVTQCKISKIIEELPQRVPTPRLIELQRIKQVAYTYQLRWLKDLFTSY